MTLFPISQFEFRRVFGQATYHYSATGYGELLMAMDFATFVVQLNDAIICENGPNLAYLLRPTSPHGKDLVKEFRNPTVCFLD